MKREKKKKKNKKKKKKNGIMRGFMLSLTDNNQADQADAIGVFNSTLR